MVGVDATAVDRLRPVFEPLGNPVSVGGVGAGHAVKALNNLLSATHLLSTAEVMAAGQRFGAADRLSRGSLEIRAAAAEAADRRPDRAGPLGAWHERAGRRPHRGLTRDLAS